MTDLPGPAANSPYEQHRSILPHVLNARGLLGEGVEVGVLRADFSVHILSHWQGQRLWLVDAWRDHEAYEEGHHAHDQNRFQAHIKMMAFPDRYEILEMFSLDAAATFADESLDFIYLDADHSYEAVRADLAAWYPKLKPGGLIAGDDYGALPVHVVNFGQGDLSFGVKQAVDEFCLAHKKNVSIDWLGDWWFPSELGTIRSRNWYFIK